MTKPCKVVVCKKLLANFGSVVNSIISLNEIKIFIITDDLFVQQFCLLLGIVQKNQLISLFLQ